VAVFGVTPQGLSRNITTRLQVFGSERHVKNDSTYFFYLNAENGFWHFTS
jgi:hypothetical protein